MPELRKDPVMGRWVIIAADRGKRPTDFHQSSEGKGVDPKSCPFCPGNEEQTPPETLAYRPEDSRPNTPGWKIRVVPNKFPALDSEGGLSREGIGIYDRMNGTGVHEVIIETPHHQETLSSISEKQLEEVLWSFRDRILDLKKDKRFKFILIFKNHGEKAGATVKHTHSQLIALPVVPRNIAAEIHGAREYYEYKERCIYCDMVRQELSTKDRLIAQNEHFVCITPYAPRFPFEFSILPKTHGSFFENSQKHEFESLAQILKDMLMRQDQVLHRPPFNFILYTSPSNQSHSHDLYYHWHLQVMPRLTHVAGFERGTGLYINPTPPEEAAEQLRQAEHSIRKSP